MLSPIFISYLKSVRISEYRINVYSLGGGAVFNVTTLFIVVSVWWVCTWHTYMRKSEDNPGVNSLLPPATVLKANLRCQFHYLWNQLKCKQLGIPVRNFLD